MKTYTPTIGIEVHAELTTKSKMFCGCKNDPHASEPNTNICPICLAHPGTLPYPNKEAVKKILMIGNAVDGELATFSEFDRKHYFYPDIPKAYQLSQYQFPFVKGGSLADVALTRIHLEEDTARSQHGEESIVDFNRSGVPLMELVTEPVVHDAASAVNFAKELQLLLRSLGVSNANMEKGEMRVEANVSVSCDNSLGTKVEVKNLNSFKAMEQAIVYEVKRQSTALEKGERIVQETRGWDENKGRTFSQRSKETAEDYRYFPDPDIPKIDTAKIDEFSKSRITEIMPKTPKDKRIFYSEISIPAQQIELIITNNTAEVFFRAVVQALQGDVESVNLAANYFTSDVFALLGEQEGVQLDHAVVPKFALLITLLKSGKLNSRVAKDLLPEVFLNGADPEEVASERGLFQVNDEAELLKIIDTVVEENQNVVAEYRSGKEASLKFLVGQCMKLSRGSANPSVLTTLLKERID